MTGVVRSGAEFLLYQSEPGAPVSRFASRETAWLFLTQMADLFQRDEPVASRHIKNFFEEGALDLASVVVAFATTAADRKTY